MGDRWAEFARRLAKALSGPRTELGWIQLNKATRALLLREARAHADDWEIAAACEAVAELFERSACGIYPTAGEFLTAAARPRELLSMNPLALSQASVHAATAVVDAADTPSLLSYESIEWIAETANGAGVAAHPSEPVYREHLDQMIDGVLCLLEAQADPAVAQAAVRP
jgi:hypothetical protein